MHRYDKRAWLLAVALAILAGYVDAIGFLRLNGLFVSFMSGNTTRLAAGTAIGSPIVPLVAAIIAGFVCGVMLGALIAARTGAARKSTVLIAVTLLLSAAALADLWRHTAGVAVLLTMAMGAANNVFQRDGEVSFGVTYMTGTLVKLGQQAVSAMLGGPRWGWLPHLLLWLGLASGALCGATLYLSVGDKSLWLACVAAAALTLAARTVAPSGGDAPS